MIWFRGDGLYWCLSTHWCVMCKSAVEKSSGHLLLHCPIALTLWRRVFREAHLSWVRATPALCVALLCER